MAVLIASDIAKDMAGEPLLRGVSFKLERRDRLTLSGRNGAGKTTLLRMLAGETSVDGGELSFAKDVRIALHDQRPPRDRDLSLRDYVLSGAKDLLDLEERLAELELAMAGGATDGATLDAYATAQARLEHAGGYLWREAINATLHGLGFRDEHLDRSLSTFSGGELTRASLARALAGDPDLLLLDEPTNHLDIESLEWLETHLQSLDAAVVLVAHDRWFLEAVGTAVLELEAGRGRFFKGTWHAWRREKAARELALGRAIEKQEAEIARLERFVDRFRAGTRARQAQSRAKRLEKMDRVSRDPRDGKALGFSFKPPERSGRVVFEVEDGRLTIGERTLLEDFELWLERGEHVSLIGPNGAGKTTLIKALAGQRELDDGKLRRGHNVKLGLLSQHADELGAKGARTVIEATQRSTGLKPNEARSLLGQFLFSGEAAEKPLDGLSGGERRRLSLAILVHSGANVLILDEPTNHLDLESREALEAALQAFQGSLLLISHDRALLDAVGTRTVAVEDGTLHSYEGGWPEFVRRREERKEAERTAKRTKPAPPPRPKPAADGPSKNQQRRAGELEKRIEAAEAELQALEAELADPAAWNDPRTAAKSTARHEDAKRSLQALYDEWEAVRRLAPVGALEADALEHVGHGLAGVDGRLERLEDVLPADDHHRVDAVAEERRHGRADDAVGLVLEPVDLHQARAEVLVLAQPAQAVGHDARGRHQHLGDVLRLLHRRLDAVGAELVGRLLGVVDDVVERDGERVHVDGLEVARAAAALGDPAEDLVRDPVAVVLEIEDLGGQLGPVGIGGEQVAQQARGRLDVAPRRLEEPEQLHLVTRLRRPHTGHRNHAGGHAGACSQPFHDRFTLR